MVKNIPDGGFDAVLTGTVEEGDGNDFYEYYVGYLVGDENVEKFFGVDLSSLSYANLISNFGKEEANWKGKAVHIDKAVMTKGRYAGTQCLSVTAK